MREAKLIETKNPCQFDFENKKIQTIEQAEDIKPNECSNRYNCLMSFRAKDILCTRLIALQVAKNALRKNIPLVQALTEEKENFSSFIPNGLFWVYRREKWQILYGKENIIDDVMDFALTIVDENPATLP